MDLREKDTAIILFCCMLMVLLVIFFLSERRKFIFEHYEISQEGCRDIYILKSKQYAVTNRGDGTQEKKFIQSRTVKINRLILLLGEDKKGTMLVDIRTGEPGTPDEVHKQVVMPVDLKVEFLPEGSCNFDFFDSDMVNYRGGVVFKGERWKYIRLISLYGAREKSVEVNYQFLGRERIDDENTGLVMFSIPDKAWLEQGKLNSIEKCRGYFWLSEDTGKIEKLEYSFFREHESLEENSSFYFEVTLTRQESEILSESQLMKARKACERPEMRIVFDKDKIKKNLPSMISRGSRGEFTEELRKRLRQKSQERFTIQIGAYSKNRGEHVNKLVKSLRKKKYSVFVLKGRGTYKVCVGNFEKDNPELEKQLEIMQRYFPGSFIREMPQP